jgi:hypothetical protein
MNLCNVSPRLESLHLAIAVAVAQGRNFKLDELANHLGSLLVWLEVPTSGEASGVFAHSLAQAVSTKTILEPQQTDH